MKTIQDYIESLFLGIQETGQIRKLKEDLLASAEDRYDDLKSQGKSENEAIGAVITEFGNIDELLEEMNMKQEYTDETGQEIDEISVEEANGFLQVQKKGALFIALGVMSILIGLSAFFAAMAIWNNGGFEEAISIVGLFLGVAVGVPLFIVAGISMTNNKKNLDDRLIPLQVKKMVEKIKGDFQRSYVFSISAGVVLCILAVIPLGAMPIMGDMEEFPLLGMSIAFLFVSAGVFLFIYAGVIMGSFTQLLKHKYFISDEDKLGPRAKEEKNRKKPQFWLVIEKIYWPLVVVSYLFQSFIAGNWGTSWIIFPIAGIIFGILESIFTSEK
ncbi:permease prefix domain 1-containing protein [Enterococcus sp. CWB-B31]|uniref:permease prefix domain 1-containing protein n=1 Tax=Enterococcus sp. CWB-B31 TaxID=2885159 RepID=UPI001E2B517B|nr:permease prefix domain 1-containing protein [Enterococcus sp. CWB-B31]MCB5954367.1 permease prefix domain 1-containing protein [Enterococcus sp. CWB-B31]